MDEIAKQFELILVDVKPDLCKAWNTYFSAIPRVTIHHGLFQDIAEFDCMVSPANSYGLMDGGIDLIIRNFFGMQVQRNVQQVIMEEFYGEQPVGTSVIVQTGHVNHPYLAHTPTMRVPADISNTDNVYNAAFAMFRAIANHNKQYPKARIEKVLCPGLGTATGRVSANEAARQMALAYKNFLNPIENYTWPTLKVRNQEILDFIV